MNHKLLLLFGCFALMATVGHGAALGTAISYQGLLTDSGNPANGAHSFQFRLFADADGGNQVGPTLDMPSHNVARGLFGASLDFGADAFNGDARWLEISVKPGGPSDPGEYIKLNPQPLPPGGGSQFARLAGDVLNGVITGQKLAPLSIATTHISDGAIVGSKIGLRSITSDNLADAAITDAKIAGEQVVKSLNGLKDQVVLTAGANIMLQPNYSNNSLTIIATSDGIGANWKLTGNVPATPNSFLGTLDRTPLELRVNNLSAMRLIPGTDQPNIVGGPNIIAGAFVNSIAEDLQGATIAGGGLVSLFGIPYPNRILSNSLYATISGGLGNTVNANAGESTIAGGNQNTIDTESTRSVIGGGFRNRVQGASSTVGGGYQNTNDSNYGVVGGGLENLLDGTTFITGGGEFPRVTNVYPLAFATIAGGVHNTNLTTGSAIGGGGLNTITFAISSPNQGYATIAGGTDNQILQGDRAAIGGGSGNRIQNNTALGFAYVAAAATVAGGQNNTASGAASSLGGGNANSAANDNATVSGGLLNTADGVSGTVPGGERNLAHGARSFAAGHRAKANHDGSFVWSSYPADAGSFADSRFHVFGYNGMSIDYSDQTGSGGGTRWIYIGPQIAGQTIATWTGAYLSDGGTWNNASDRHRKTNFASVDPLEMLKKVAGLPLYHWSYTNETSVGHLGPVAQDFQATFHLGSDDKSIATVDADGVALAAIQGLNAVVEQGQTKIAELEQRNRTLEQRLNKLEEEFRTRASGTSENE